ncbi:glycoside hydrolase [Hypomontagnella submonticulosa]|nr:glycoside hydrolase [Hypomontagnella submonticulosa]
MKSSILLGSVLLGQSSAHFLFGRLILEGKWTKTWEYVREVSPENTTYIYNMVSPLIDPSSIEIRCGRNASPAQSPVKTATVHAGDTVGFAAGEPKLPYDDRPLIYHPGPLSAWLSKSPTDDLDSYAGDGDWFKILSVTNRTEQSLDFSLPENKKDYDPLKADWGSWNLDSYNFTIPKTTPPGKYLLRLEHIYPQERDAQWFVNCAQIDVINTDLEVGTPGPLVKIPGVYTHGQKDLYFEYWDENLKVSTYIPPEPAVWTG